MTNPPDLALYHSLTRLRAAYDRLLSANTRTPATVTPAEHALERNWSRDLEPVLTDLYWVSLNNGLDNVPTDGRKLRKWLRDRLGAAASVAALLLLLQRYQKQAVDIGGNMALDQLGLDGTFRLTNPELLDELDQQADDLTSLDTDLSLIDTTVDDLVTGIPQARDSEGDTLILLGGMIAGWAAYRSDLIAVTEEARQVTNGQQWAYGRNGVEQMIYRTRENSCPICSPDEGTIVPVDNPGDLDPPRHSRCRCFWEAYTDGWTAPDETWTGD